MNTTSTFDSDFSTTTTNLMDLVAAVSEFTDSDQETIQVVRHMLRSRKFWYSGEMRSLEAA